MTKYLEYDYLNLYDDANITLKDYRTILRKSPFINIVQCKNCKYYNKYTRICLAPLFDEEDKLLTNKVKIKDPEHYCGFGDQKEEPIYLDARALEKEGWRLERTVPSMNSITLESKKPTDFPTTPNVALPVYGEWLDRKDDKYYNIETGQCSVCKERRRVDKYCPNCGSIMRG